MQRPGLHRPTWFQGVALALLLLATPLRLWGQTFRVVSEKPAYEYAEVMRFTATLTNTRPDTTAFGFGDWGAFFTNGQIAFDGRNVPFYAGGPTVPQTIRLAPGHRIDWPFYLHPPTANLPRKDGVHWLRADLRVAFNRASHVLTDSVAVSAPEFRGGTIQLAFRHADSVGVAEERVRLGARVTSDYRSSSKSYQYWRFDGPRLDTILTRLRRDPRFLDVEELAYATVGSQRIVGAETDTPAGAGSLAPPWPHPFTSATTLRYIPAASGPVRADLYDALGRHVQLLYQGMVVEGAPLLVHVEGRSLPAGTYVVRLSAPHQTFSRLILRR